MRISATCLTCLTCSTVSTSLLAQGLINWNNTANTLISVNGSPMPVRVSSATTYYFGLFIAPLGTQAPSGDGIYDPKWQYVVAYATNSTAAAGAGRLQNPGTATVVGYAPETNVSFIVRGWQSYSGGADWEAAKPGLTALATSAMGTLVLGGGPFPVFQAFGTGSGQISGFNFFGCPECYPPWFTLYPSNAVVGLGGNVSLSAYANSWFPVLYQWHKQGVSIPGANDATLTLSSVTLLDAGNYQVVASNPFGMVGSPVVTLTVLTPATMGSPSYAANNQFQFTVTGAAGSSYVVQVATNLSTLTTWVSLLTNTSPFTFVDTNAQNFPQRFYRVQAR